MNIGRLILNMCVYGTTGHISESTALSMREKARLRKRKKPQKEMLDRARN